MPPRTLIRLFGRGWDEWDEKRQKELAAAPVAEAPKAKRKRFSAALAFCALFFAGLALSAGAGNSVRALLDDSSEVPQDQSATTSSDAALDTATPAQAVLRVQGVRAGVEAASKRPAQVQAFRHSTPVREQVSRAQARPSTVRHRAPSGTRSTVAKAAHATHRSARSHPKVRPSSPEKTQPLDGEASLPGATVWLYQAAPDPTPPAARLRLRFARELVAYARQAGVDWALVLAVLRSQGHDGRVPAKPAQLRSLSLRLAQVGGRANGWAAALAMSHDTTFADRTVALRHYYRAVGMASLVFGLLSQKRDLEDRVLHDARVQIYPGGRNDIARHRVDARVLAALLYLADTFHGVTASCLISGHGLYARPGVISAHIYGRAVDIAALGETPIYGHQGPGGVTEQGVRALLMLPPGMLPAQIISLLGLGGPSFPLANHYDHIHIGY